MRGDDGVVGLPASVPQMMMSLFCCHLTAGRCGARRVEVLVVVLEVVSGESVSGGGADLPACWHSCGPKFK